MNTSKKALVFLGMQDYMGLEEAMIYYNNNYDIYVVSCDMSARMCNVNFEASKAKCLFCHRTMKIKLQQFIKKYGWHYVSLKDLITSEMKEKAKTAIFEYNNVSQLKQIHYRGVEIGYAAFSTFVSYSRNVMPNFNKHLQDYLNFSMRRQMQETDALIKYVDEISPDVVIFFNGRTSFVKPICCIARNRGIEYIATERCSKDDEMLQNDFHNDIPHSFSAITTKIEKYWLESGDNKYDIARKFFENRKNSKPAGDTIYTKNQHKGELPKGFDIIKRNITIFNSSEDEYCAIGKEYDDSALFTNQYEALKTIFEHYKNDNSIHFYLRIHPNLANVPYNSHTMLYYLKYDNVTIIAPRDTVSSYALMENSEKVIVFMSTIGLESSFWGKPVIALNKCYYSDQHIVYEPKSIDELFNMIDDKNLKKIEGPIDKWYKVALYFMGCGPKPYKYFPTYIKHINIPFGNRYLSYTTGMTFLGSEKLFGLVNNLIYILGVRGILAKFSRQYLKKTI